jgi:hypothetical protein
VSFERKRGKENKKEGEGRAGWREISLWRNWERREKGGKEKNNKKRLGNNI